MIRFRKVGNDSPALGNWAFDVVANATESLYSMINLDRLQDGGPLHLAHPTPCYGPFNRRRCKVLGASVSPQDRNLWHLRP